jgi:hypothetical protein
MTQRECISTVENYSERALEAPLNLSPSPDPQSGLFTFLPE